MSRFIVLIFIFFMACSKPVPTEQAASPPFNISEFIRMEANRLENENARIEKTVIWKGEKETGTIENPDWNKEIILAPGFKDDTLYWHQKFTLETRKSDGENLYIYTAIEPDYPVREIRIGYGEEGISEIWMFSYAKTPLYTSARITSYNPKNHFLVSGFSEVKGLEKVTYGIKSLIRL